MLFTFLGPRHTKSSPHHLPKKAPGTTHPSPSFLLFYFSCAWLQCCQGGKGETNKVRENTRKEEEVTPIKEVNKHSKADKEFHNTVETILMELE